MQHIAVLGYGKEGQAVENYFTSRGDKVTVFDNFTREELAKLDLAPYDTVFRSPSVPVSAIPGVKKSENGDYILPANLTSSTKYFFEHCPCKIIGVTGTKGKGTTCSMLAAILKEAGKKVHLLGNIGLPAISELDNIQPEDIVVFEMSSFQLWDLDKSPEIAVVLRIEPDHLDVHDDFADYVDAKSHIVAYQKPEDTCIYFRDNQVSVAIAERSPASHKIPYPSPESENLKEILDCLTIPGQHNRENAQAAIAAASVVLQGDYREVAKRALAHFKGLPHHLELVRTLNNVDYYDDSFSASYPSMDVAISSLENTPTILIAGGKNRHLDLKNARKRIFSAPSVKKALLLGETAVLLAEGQERGKYELCSSLKEAVEKAKQYAEAEAAISGKAAVLLSPGAASFDMFKNFIDRGEQFQEIVRSM